MENAINIKRKNWIDVLRALAILFVIYGHLLDKSSYSYIYFVFTSPIKIPLFFAISGYLFKESRDFKTFVKRLVKGLVVPWLSLSTLPVLFLSFFKGISYFNSNISSILIGKMFWYMPCCIIAEIIFYFLLQSFKDDRLNIGVIITISWLGVLLIHHGILDFLMINRSFSVQFFLLIGYLYRKRENTFDNVRVFYLVIGFTLYVLLGLISIYIYSGQNLDVHRGIYYSPTICITMIILGCGLLFILGKRLDFGNKILVFIGKNTLVYYIWSGYSTLILITISSRLVPLITNNYFSALFKTIFVSCLCAVFSVLINRFIPLIVGKKNGS